MPGPVLMMGAHTRTTQEPHPTHTRTAPEPFANHLRTICEPCATDRPSCRSPELRGRSIDPHPTHTRTRTTPEPFANHLRTICEPFSTYGVIAACFCGTLESQHVPCSLAMSSGIAAPTGCTSRGMVNAPLAVATFPSSPREPKFSLFSTSLHPN